MPIGIDMNNYDISMGTGQIRMSGGGGIAGNVYINGNVGIGTANPTAKLDVNGTIKTTDATQSTDTTSGALQVVGGIGIGGRIYAGGVITTTTTLASTSTTTGALVVAGGAGIGGRINAGGIITTTTVTASTDTTTGALVVGGGAGIAGAVNIGGNLTTTGSIKMGTSNLSYKQFSLGGGNSYGYLYGAFNQLGDGIHMGYNAYNDNASWKLNTTGMGSGTSRISMGYGYIGLYTAPEGSSPPTNVGIYQNSSGQVGIGTSSPTAPLTVNGQTNSIRNTSSSTLSGSLATAAFNVNLVTGLTAGSYASALSWSSQTTSGYNQNAFLGSKRDSVSNFGSVIIGVGSTDTTINQEFLFSSNSNAYCPGTWQTSSDVRLKTDITDADLNICYDNMKKLKLRRWKWRNDEIPELMKIDKHQLGWIAQELEEISPNSVSTMGMYGIEDCKHIETIQIQSFMYGTIQKLMNITEQQQIIIEQLQQRIQVLESK